MARAEALKSRLKERYRILVRKLHPDMNPGLSAEEISLWHQVQSAYQRMDLEQMDLLVALSDAFSGRISRHTSLHQLRTASLEIARLIEPLRRKLEEAKRNRAWKFSEQKDHSRLHQTLEKELIQEMRKLKQLEAQLDTQLERFARRRPRQPSEAQTEEAQPF